MVKFRKNGAGIPPEGRRGVRCALIRRAGESARGVEGQGEGGKAVACARPVESRSRGGGKHCVRFGGVGEGWAEIGSRRGKKMALGGARPMH